MKSAPSIPLRRGPPSQTSFESLRAEGIRWLQQASGERWTDYNLHDPGITVLEQLCFALTDLAYRADFPVADLLCGPDGHIAYEALGLHPPQAALPCRPATVDDHCRVLLDQVHGLAGVGLAPLPSASLQGLYRLTVESSSEEEAATVCGDAQAVFMTHRQLGEDLDGPVRPMQPWWCSLQAHLELEGSRDPLDVAAQVLAACARYLAAPVEFVRLDELQREGLPLDRILEGPAMRHGFIADAALRRQREEFLFVCDLLELVRGIDGVKEVMWLALQPDGGEPETGMLRWRDARSGHVLRLRLPDEGEGGGEGGGEGERESLGAGEGGLQLWRRGSRIELPARELRAKVDEQRKAHLGPQRQGAAIGSADLPMPVGRHRKVTGHSSVQSLFPPVYGINAHGLPASVGPRRQAQASQLRAFLALCEQHLAHGAAQLGHLRELFGTDARAPQSYWWQTLDERAMHGLEALMLPDSATSRHELDRAWREMDPALERKSRALDHVLALHGQSWPQDTLRHFWAHFDDDEVERELLRAKAAFAQQVVVLNRDRAAGFDYTRPAWDAPDNCSGLQRMVSHLLGLRRHATRSLVAAATDYNRALTPDGTGWMAEPPGGIRLALDPAWQRPERSAFRDELLKLAPVRQRGLAEPMMRAGLYRDRYWWSPRPAGGHHLVLGPDEQGRYWPLAEYSSEPEAAFGAQCLRSFLLSIDQASEGLHVVEHVLLRGPGPESADPGFYSGRVSVVLPAWTERFRQPNFRSFAEETVALACPAHLQPRCLWLDFETMQRFEAAHRRWLAAQRLHGSGAGDGGDAESLHAAALALAGLLREPMKEAAHD